MQVSSPRLRDPVCALWVRPNDEQHSPVLLGFTQTPWHNKCTHIQFPATSGWSIVSCSAEMSHILLLLLLLTFETAASEGRVLHQREEFEVMGITVRSGQDVTLDCQSPRGVNITLLEWSRPEIKTDGYVFFYRNQRSYENYQHERFKGRVELADPSMKNGDVSVILKNVNINDTGTYECRIRTSDLSSGQRVQSDSRTSINLTVIDSGVEDKPDKKTLFLAIGVVAVFVSFLVILSAAVCVHRKKKSSKYREHEHYKHSPEKELI